MLFELGAITAGISGTLLAYEGMRKLFKNKTDLVMIEELFKNLGVGIPKGEGKKKYIQYPRLINKDVGAENKLYDTYVFSVPLGITFSKFKTLEEHLTDGIGRDVKIETGERIAKIKVARQVLSDNIPLQPFLGKTFNWNVLIGVNAFEVVTHDFEKYPMVIGGGATRFGKTVLMKNVKTQLVLQEPENVKFYIIDLKGGLEFLDFENLKQVEKVVSTPSEALKLLGYLAEEWLPKRMDYFREKGYKNIINTPIKERVFLIVDETHDLFKTTDPKVGTAEKKKIENYMSKLASMGGGLGFRIMAFTQYPVKEAMPQFVKQNAPVRIGFQTADGVASRVIMDHDGLQDLPGIPGRCMIKSFKYTTVQVPAYLKKENGIWEVGDYFDLVKQYEVIKNEPEHGTETSKGNRDLSQLGPVRLPKSKSNSKVTPIR